MVGFWLPSQWGGEAVKKNNLGKDEQRVSWGNQIVRSLPFSNVIYILWLSNWLYQEQAAKEAASAAAKEAYEAAFANCSDEIRAAQELAAAAAEAAAKTRKVKNSISCAMPIYYHFL